MIHGNQEHHSDIKCLTKKVKYDENLSYFYIQHNKTALQVFKAVIDLSMAFFAHVQRRSGKEERGNNGEREEIEKQLLFRLWPSLSSPSIGTSSGKPLYKKACFVPL